MKELTEEQVAARLNKEVSEGVEAKKALEVLDKAATEYRDGLIQAFFKSTSEEKDKREEIYRQQKALDTVINSIAQAVTTGIMAQEQLNELEGNFNQH